MMDMTLDQFESLVRRRRSVRNFKPDPIAPELLDRLIASAQWAPSGYNLQPTHFVLVTDPRVKTRLRAACMDQRQVEEAPAIIVLVGDRRVVDHQFTEIVAMEKSAGTINDEYERLLRKFVPLAFGHGPLGLGWLAKAIAPPLTTWLTPTPSIPAVHKRFWLTKQVLLSAMVLMLAATAAGLATVPMEGFDERRVKRVLGIGRGYIVPLVLPVGYAADGKRAKTRLPIERFVHRDRW
jgi:nitroreductase